MNNDQKKLLMIQDIIDANHAYYEKNLKPLKDHLLEAALKDEYDLMSIKKVLQGNFDI